MRANPGKASIVPSKKSPLTLKARSIERAKKNALGSTETGEFG